MCVFICSLYFVIKDKKTQFFCTNVKWYVLDVTGCVIQKVCESMGHHCLGLFLFLQCCSIKCLTI